MSQLPPGWTHATLGEVALWGSGGTPRANVGRYYGGGIPWAVIGDLNDATVYETASSITKDGLAESSARLVPHGTVLIAMYGSIGKLGIAGVEMATNQAIAFAQPHRSVEARFLFWYLRSQRGLLGGAGKGATQTNISQTILRPWPIPIPPLSEQRRIVTAIEEQLSRIDAADASLVAAFSRLEVLERTAIIVALGNHWPKVSLGDVATIDSGPAFKSAYFGGPNDGVKLLRGENIEPGALRWRDTRTWPLSLLDGYEHLFIEATDLILAMDRPVISTGLKLAPVNTSDLPALLVQRVARIRPLDCVLPGYLYAALRHPAFVPHLIGDQTGTQLPHITLAGIRSFELALPPLDEQFRIATRIDKHLSAIDGLRATIVRARHRSRSLRHAVLNTAFRGELVRQDPSDEPALLLLERMRSQRDAAPATARSRRVQA